MQQALCCPQPLPPEPGRVKREASLGGDRSSNPQPYPGLDPKAVIKVRGGRDCRGGAGWRLGGRRHPALLGTVVGTAASKGWAPPWKPSPRTRRAWARGAGREPTQCGVRRGTSQPCPSRCGLAAATHHFQLPGARVSLVTVGPQLSLRDPCGQMSSCSSAPGLTPMRSSVRCD